MSIACYALHIRHPRAHILPSLTATCQVCTVALKAGLSTYNTFGEVLRLTESACPRCLPVTQVVRSQVVRSSVLLEASGF